MFIIAFALIALAIVFYVFKPFNFFSAPCPPPCTGLEEKRVTYYVFANENDTIGTPRDTTIRLSYDCNEIIFDASGKNTASAELVRQYLRDQIFIQVDSCACGEPIELWRFNGVGDADVIGVIKDPPGDVGSIGGLSANYYTLPDSPSDSTNNGSDNLPNANPDPGPNVAEVKIAIVDTGVDISLPNTTLSWPDPQDYLFPFLRMNTDQPCNKIPSVPFGVNVLNFSLPSDLNGHGTHVNGIIAGYPTQAGSHKGVRFEFLNVKYTRGDTGSGSLFKAVCGIYYAIQQKAEIINISWGFLDNDLPEMLESAIRKDTNVIFVTGLRNNGKGFGGAPGSLRFWPAGFSTSYNNVISVGASNTANNMASFSNWGNINIMNVVAPGENIVSTFPKYLQWTQSGLAVNSGTSMATPFVTRTIAVMIGLRKSVSHPYKPLEIKKQLLKAANPNRNAATPKFDYHHDDVVGTWPT